MDLNTTADPWHGLDDINDDELGKLLDKPLPSQEAIHLRTNEQHIGFDSTSGSTWIYPSNLPCRSYQYSITHAALFRNTLVVLPTGLGKTFIAAVVMYNIYRWYPNGKVIFMAPTRPLVAQQIEACQRIMPFPVQDTVELTGKLQRAARQKLWRSKRVFFATPQVVRMDMCTEAGNENDFPFDQVKLLVVDEAHKARGRYAYTEVVQALGQRNRYFRVLALSATPGRTMDDVADVVRNLLISHLEVRWDTSIDVAPFVHHRSMKTIVVRLDSKIKRVSEELIKITDPYMRQLIDAGVLSGSHQHITRNFLIMEQKRFREHSMQQTHPQQAAVTSNFSICISLIHSLELLERHGLRVFLNSFDDDADGRPKFVLTMNPYLRDLVSRLHGELGPNPFDISAHTMTNGKIAEMPKDLEFGHPKFEEARKALLAHFEQNPNSRAIVFCEYRESVMLIQRLLLQHVPLLNSRCFVGQGGRRGTLPALPQQQQIEIMNDFRSGKCNILIATSIGEEGIDVGEVDLIVCFDMCTTNPTRFIQRIGRTGRQKKGHVVMLVTEGKEQQILKEVLAQKDQMNKKLQRSAIVQAAFYKQAPRLVPAEYSPECVKTFMKPAEVEETTTTMSKATKLKKIAKITKAPKAANSIQNSQDLRKFFKKIESNCDDDVVEVFETPHIASTQCSAEQSMEQVKNLFRHINVGPLTNTNTQLLETQLTPEPAPARLEKNELRRINRLLKYNTKVKSSQDSKALLKQLKATNFSLSGKLKVLKCRYVEVREICEKMDILQALEMEDVISPEEQEIRETFNAILACFEDRDKLERLLDDAEFESREEAREAANKAAERDEMDMTDKEFEFALNKAFEGLDEQGNCWDSFDYRQEELKKTKAYTKAMDELQKSINNEAKSEVFDVKLSELDSSSFTITDSKYCSQWEKDFEQRRLPNKSTPIQGPLAKAFERQKHKKQSVSRKLETVIEKSGRSGNVSTDDIVLLSSDESCLENDDKTLPLAEDLQKLQHAIETSFLLRQQSTPIQHKTLRAQSPVEEITIQHELDLDLDVFNEPLPEELELIYNQREICTNSSQSSSKENSQPTRLKSTTETTTKKSSDLFHLLEAKPTNSIITPRRSKNVFKSRSNSSELTTASKMLASPKNHSNSTEFTSPKFTSTSKLLDSPKNRLDSPELMPKKFTTAAELLASIKNNSNSPEFTSPKWTSTAKLLASPKNRPDTPEFSSPKSTTDAKSLASPTNHQNSSEFTFPKWTSTAKLLSSPKNRPTTAAALEKYERSPTVFETYSKGLQRMDSLRRLHSKNLEEMVASCGGNITSPITNVSKATSSTTFAQEVDSPIIRKPTGNHNLKRKLLDSSTESEATPTKNTTKANSDSDFEEIIGTQQFKRRCLPQRREKRLRRARLNSFFDNEAEKSGASGHTTDDFGKSEDSLDNFVCDSVIVPDTEDHEASAIDAPTSTQMQAIYLQSVRSPHQGRGAFKIPARLNPIEALDIYSQELPIEESQYADDTFVVNHGDVTVQQHAETSLCPLERAEFILKERKRAAKRRRQLGDGNGENLVKKKRLRKCYQLKDDSDTSDGIG